MIRRAVVRLPGPAAAPSALPSCRGLRLLKKLLPKDRLVPHRSVHPHLYENGTLYDGRALDDARPFEPIVVHHAILEQRYAAYLKDREAGKFPELDIPPVPMGEWNAPVSARTGLIAIKLKMYHFWDEHSNYIPVTMLWVPNCTVVDHRWPAKHGYWANVVAAGYPNDDDPLHYLEPNLYKRVSEKVKDFRFRHVVREFPVTEDGMLPLGFRLTVRHFVPGQWVDIFASSKGKGFEGVVKRWGFHGGPASHGASLFHRRPGSIGTLGDSMVRPGKKMPGHMGNQRRLIKTNVFMVDFKNDLLYVAGGIPGDKRKYVIVEDGFWKNFEHGEAPPFPSFLPDPKEDLSALSFDECQLRGPSRWQWHRDFGPER